MAPTIGLKAAIDERVEVVAAGPERRGQLRITFVGVPTTDENAQPVTEPQRRRSIFRRGEDALAHVVYGLILTLATVGELIHHEESAEASIAWLIGAGVVLLAAHLFSDVLAHLAMTREDPNWSETLRIGREDVSVTAGFIGAALIMAVAALADLDTQGALYTCVVAGLVAVAALSFYATAHHRPATRVLMSAAAAVLGAVIILGENTF